MPMTHAAWAASPAVRVRSPAASRAPVHRKSAPKSRKPPSQIANDSGRAAPWSAVGIPKVSQARPPPWRRSRPESRGRAMCATVTRRARSRNTPKVLGGGYDGPPMCALPFVRTLAAMKTPTGQLAWRKVAGMIAAAAIGSSSVAAALARPGPWPALARYEAMAVPADNPMTRDKVALGRQVFFDRRLSGDATAACASCHRPEHGFADGQARPQGAYGRQSGRACPTLWNVGYQQSFFWEGSGSTLEGAVAGMWRFNLAPGKEGQLGVADVAGRLREVPGYRRQFESVFGEPPTPENVPKAIAAFLRTLVASDSAWVRFHDGNAHALSGQARAGWAVFDGKGRCT